MIFVSTVIFDRETLKVTGVDREKFPYEVEIRNVDVEGLTKVVQRPAKREKVNEEGKPVYLLPQEPLVEEIGVSIVTGKQIGRAHV